MQLDRVSVLETKISNLEYRDSLFNVFMEPDFSHMFSYRIRNGKPLSYTQLSVELDSLHKLNASYRVQLELVPLN